MNIQPLWWHVEANVTFPQGLSEQPNNNNTPAIDDTLAIKDTSLLKYLPKKTAQCSLCVHACHIPYNKSGRCGVRFFGEQGFTSPYLGRFCSVGVDPMEKKPLYHFMPGTFILSLGSVGCTMRCVFCQNHGIAQPQAQKLPPMQTINLASLATMIKKTNVASLAYTYNEPSLQAEYILAAGPMLQEMKIATVLVTNGMLSHTVLPSLLPYVDALNVDLKTFNAKAYTKLGGSLEHVLSTITKLVQAGKHIELTTLVVPGISDDMDEFVQLVDWVHSLSPHIPLHISRYFPAHKYTAPATNIEHMKALHTYAKSKLTHCHLGNIR